MKKNINFESQYIPDLILYRNIKNNYFKEIKNVNSDIHNESCIYYLNDILKRLEKAFISIKNIDMKEYDIINLYLEFILDIQSILHDFQYVSYINDIVFDDGYTHENYDRLLSLCNYSLSLYGQIILELKKISFLKHKYQYIVYYKEDYINNLTKSKFIEYFNRILGYKTISYYNEIISTFFKSIKNRLDEYH